MFVELMFVETANQSCGEQTTISWSSGFRLFVGPSRWLEGNLEACEKELAPKLF